MAALVWSPALAASPPLCTLPAPGTIPLADHLAEEPAKPSPPPTSADVPSPLPEALASMPFVQHVASAGAVVSDLGSSHGMRAIAARNGDQFMLFQVTPDGQAAVSGATVELAPAQLETIASGNITDLGVRHGLQGFLVRRYEDYIVIVYSTLLSHLDGESITVLGSQSDEDGVRVTSRINGVVPITVDWQLNPTNNGYKVINLFVSGINMASMQRSDLISVIQRNSGQMEALLVAMRDKNASNGILR
jgi:hypothetical protein